MSATTRNLIRLAIALLELGPGLVAGFVWLTVAWFDYAFGGSIGLACAALLLVGAGFNFGEAWARRSWR